MFVARKRRKKAASPSVLKFKKVFSVAQALATSKRGKSDGLKR